MPPQMLQQTPFPASPPQQSSLSTPAFTLIELDPEASGTHSTQSCGKAGRRLLWTNGRLLGLGVRSGQVGVPAAALGVTGEIAGHRGWPVQAAAPGSLQPRVANGRVVLSVGLGALGPYLPHPHSGPVSGLVSSHPCTDEDTEAQDIRSPAHGTQHIAAGQVGTPC